MALVGVTTVWVILQNNGRTPSSPDSPPVADYVLVLIPRAARVVEAVVLAAGAVLFWRRYRRTAASQVAAAIGVLTLIGLVGMVRAPGQTLSQLQGIYVYVAPFLVFLWVVAARPTAREVRWAIVICGVYLAANILVMFAVQLPAHPAAGDWDRGLFSDAHAFGTWLAIVSCVSFSVYVRALKLRWLALSVAALLVSYFPSNEKMIVFNLCWLAGSGVRALVAGRAMRYLVVLGLLAIGSVVAWHGGSDDTSGFLRLAVLEGRPLAEIGPVAAWRAVGPEFVEDPPALLIGEGPANYGGVAAGRTLVEDRGAATQASYRMREMLVSGAGVAGAFAMKTNTWSNLLVEFGAFGLLSFVAGLVTVMWRVVQWKPENRFDAVVRLLGLCLFGAVMFQGFVTPYTNWEEPVLTYPWMLFAGYGWSRLRARMSPQS